MKANEFLKLINANVKGELPEDLLAKLDVELPADFDTKFNAAYMTPDRAQNDDAIITAVTKKANKKIFTDIDEQIKEFLPLVSSDVKQKIDSTFSTLDKIKLLKPAIDEAFTKTKGKGATEEINKVQEEWAAKHKALEDRSKLEKEQLLKAMEDKNFEFVVSQKLAGYKLADSFTKIRPQLIQMGLLSLKEKGYKYEMENGDVVVRQEKDGVLRDVYDGDKKVTFSAILDTFIDPFIAKSNEVKPPNGDNTKPPITPITGGEDLNTLMRKQAVNQH